MLFPIRLILRPKTLSSNPAPVLSPRANHHFSFLTSEEGHGAGSWISFSRGAFGGWRKLNKGQPLVYAKNNAEVPADIILPASWGETPKKTS